MKVSLLPGDVYTKAAVEAVKEIKKNIPSVGDVAIHVYPTTGIKTLDLQHLRESKLVVMLQRGTELSTVIKQELEDVLRQGGKVYAVGSYSDDDKRIGILADGELKKYFEDGVAENIENGILYALNDVGLKIPYAEPSVSPQIGIYDRKTKTIFSEFKDYQKQYASFRTERPWVGMIFFRGDELSGNAKHIDTLIHKLEQNGFNVLPVFGYPESAPIEKFFFDEAGRARVRAVIGVSMKFPTKPAEMVVLLTKLNVPFINAIALYAQSQEALEQSKIGLDIFERGWQVATTELMGLIQPTVFATKERVKDPATGLEYLETRPIPQRVERLVQRVKAWINLQDKPNKDKVIAIMYWNSPPGTERIGASYLNVLPDSLWQMYRRLEQEGYSVGASPISKETLYDEIIHYARNIGNWDQKQIDQLAESGRATLIPIDTYRKWLMQIPAAARKKVLSEWGPPELSKTMMWRDREGKQYIVIPFVRFGNIIFTPQPARGWAEDPDKLYHNTTLAPHHQYIAFYTWLKQTIRVDAVVSVGVHGSHEWLPGREVGFLEEDFSEFLLKDIPNIYPYIMDNLGEGTQAKRRGLAVMISHMTPPFDKPGLNPQLKELAGLLSDFQVALEKSLPLAESKLADINALATKMGVLKNLGIDEIKMPAPEFHDEHEAHDEHEGHEGHEGHDGHDDIHVLEHYLNEISEKATPFGLPTFGVAPEPRYISSTAEAILSVEKNLSAETRERRIQELEELIHQSAPNELDSFAAGLAGRYIPAGPGNDPIRNPEALPTGKNFYSFDPRKVPSKAIYEMGAKLARDLIAGYQKQHGELPDKLAFNLWATETMRHEGVQESQILYTMGIKPKWNERGTVEGVEAISREELGRARIDVTMVPTGGYRDMFSNLMDLLDQAVTLAKIQGEEDNLVRKNVLKTKTMLMQKGIADDLAERLATVRIFTEPTGAYGTNLNNVIAMSHTWENEKQVADVYFMRLGYMFGQGFWSEKVESNGEDMGLALFKNSLSGTKMVVHSRSSNVYATLDNDDVFQYVGGTAMAVRSIDGKSPETYLTNMSDPNKPVQETLEKFMGREMQSRYLNPEWIKAMLAEGYAGAMFINSEVFENLWGFQVTVPEVVDAAKWNEMYETYVKDRNQIEVEQLFRKANNLMAYRALMARMLEVVRKGYWRPPQEVVDNLSQRVGKLIQELKEDCTTNGCADPILNKLVQANLVPVPVKTVTAAAVKVQNSAQAASAAPAPENAAQAEAKAESKSVTQSQTVKGYAMEDVSRAAARSSVSATAQWLGFLLLCLILLWGFYGAYQWRHVAWRRAGSTFRSA